MADKFTGTYTSNNKTLTLTKADANGANKLSYKAGTTTTFGSDDYLSTYGSDTKTIDASGLAAKFALNLDAAGAGPTTGKWAETEEYSGTTLAKVILGKGADTVTAHGNLTITTGAGKDVIALTSDTGTITITDYAAGSDVLRFSGKSSSSATDNFDPTVTVSDVKMNGDVVLNVGTASVTLTNMKDKKVTIVDATGAIVMDQPFQRSEDLILTNANSGTIAASDKNIDASARSKGIRLNASNAGTTELTNTTGQIVIGGKANDTVSVNSAYQTLTGGKGNDYFIISSDTLLIKADGTKVVGVAGGSALANIPVVATVTDWTLGQKDKAGDRLIFGDGVAFSTVMSNGVNGYAIFSETTSAAASRKIYAVDLGTSAVWDQIKPTDYKNGGAVLVADATGKDTGDGYSITDPDLYVESKQSKAATFNLGTQVAATGNYSKPKISYAASSKSMTVTAPTASGTSLREVFGGTGKDSLFGADSGTAMYGATAVNVGGTSLHGGKGNDYIVGGATAAYLAGDEGNDTLRTGSNNATVRALEGSYAGDRGDATMQGGAGNDVFLLTGDGDAAILDYTNTTDKTVKKARGTDKLVVANDKWNGKGVARSYITSNNNPFTAYWSKENEDGTTTYAGNKVDDDYDSHLTLNLAVSGSGWVDSVSAAAAKSTDFKGGTGVATDYNVVTYHTLDGQPATVSGDFAQPFGQSTYSLYGLVGSGQKINIQNQGITYTQVAPEGNYAKDSQVTVNANYLGYLNPLAVKIDGSKSKKAMRLIAATTTVTKDNITTYGGTATADSDTTIIGGAKADTLIGSKYMTGGKGNDVFDVSESSNVVITDYYGETKKDKDKIYGLMPEEETSVKLSTDGKDVIIGSVTIKGAAGQTVNGGITFTTDDYYYNINKKGVITGEKKNTHTMVREFKNGATVVSAAKGSTNIYTYGKAGDGTYDFIDSDVVVINASRTGKNTYIGAASGSVFSIVGSAKNDTFNVSGYQGAYHASAAPNVAVEGTGNDATAAVKAKDRKIGGTGAYFSDTVVDGLVTIQTGKGNDVINVDATGGKALYITDFTAGAVDKTKGTFKSGDILGLSIATKANSGDAYNTGDATGDVDGGGSGYDVYDSDVSVVGGKLFGEAVGAKNFAKPGALAVDFDGNDVRIGNVVLAGAKGKAAWVGSVAEGMMVTLNNLTEVDVNVAGGSKKSDLVKKGAIFTADLGVSNDKNVDLGDIKSIDASLNTKGAVIQGGTYVHALTGGKGVDTIYAGLGSDVTATTATAGAQTITGGAGADLIIFDADTVKGGNAGKGITYTIADYAADKLFLDGMTINYATYADGNDTVSVGKGSNAKVYHTSDVTLHVTATNTKTADIVFKGLNGSTNFKLTQVDSVTGKANAFSLQYGASDITVTAADAGANVTIDLTGTGYTNDDGTTIKMGTITVDDNRSKAVGFKNAVAGSIIVAGKKAAVSVTGAEVTEANATNASAATSHAITFLGNVKNDYYAGLGATDTVVLGSGADTIFGGGRASVSAGAGNDVIIVKAGDSFKLTDYANAKGDADKLAFSTLDFTGDKAGVREIKFVQANGAVLGKDGKAEALAITFDSDTTAAAPTSKTATIYLQGYKTDGSTAIAMSKFSTTAKGAGTFTSIGNLGYGFAAIGGDSNSENGIANIFVGSTAADTITASVRATMTGGKGNDTFIVNSDTTITDFNTSGGKDTLSFAQNSSFKLTDYSNTYIYEGGEDATLLGANGAKEGTVILKGVGNTTKKVTSAIRVNGDTTGVVLSDQAAIVLTNKNQVTNFNLDNTKTFNGAKNSSGVNFTGSTVFESFVGTTKGDKLFFTTSETAANASKAGNVTLGGGDDQVTLGSNKQTITFTGGKDVISGVTSSNLSVAAGSGLSFNSVSGGAPTTFTASGASTAKGNTADKSDSSYYATATATSDDVTFSVVNSKNKDAGSVELKGANITFTQKIERSVHTQYVAPVTEVKDSDGKVTTAAVAEVQQTYDWKRTISVKTDNGISIDNYFTETKTDTQANPWSTTVKSEFAEIIGDDYEALFGAGDNFGVDEFDEITPAKAEVDVSSTSESEVDSVIKGVTATFAGVGKQRQDK